MKCLMVTEGLHLPWNQGEVVIPKHFVPIIAKNCDRLLIISVIDQIRGFHGKYKVEINNVQIVYTSSLDKIGSIIKNFNINKDYYLYLFNIPMLSLPMKVFLNSYKTFTYLYTLKNMRTYDTTVRSMLWLLSSGLYKKANIITSSPMVYSMARKLHNYSVFYIPMPMESIPNYSKKKKDILNITYLGHADFARFPFHKVIPAIYNIAKNDINFRLRIFFSDHKLKDNKYFYTVINRLIEKYKLSNIIKVFVKNLSDSEKINLYKDTHIFLYPSMVELAVDPPLTIMESMSYGSVVVATNVQSIPYILNNKRGIVINKNNLMIDMYRSLKNLLLNPNIIDEIGKRASTYIRAIHDSRRLSLYFKNLFD